MSGWLPNRKLSPTTNKEDKEEQAMSNKQYVKHIIEDMKEDINKLEDIYNDMDDNMEDENYSFTDAIEVLQSTINSMKAYVI